MTKFVLIEPGQDPFTGYSENGKGGGGLSLPDWLDGSWIFIILCGLIFVGYLFWQFTPKVSATALTTPTITPEWLSPTPTATAIPTQTARPEATASATPLPTGIISGKPQTTLQVIQVPVEVTRKVEVTRQVQVQVNVPVEVTRQVQVPVQVKVEVTRLATVLVPVITIQPVEVTRIVYIQATPNPPTSTPAPSHIPIPTLDPNWGITDRCYLPIISQP